MRQVQQKKLLYRFAGWFFLVNTLLCLLVGINYFNAIPDFKAFTNANFISISLGWGFLITAFIAQISILFFIPCAVVILIIALLPYRRIIFPLSILLGSIVAFALVVESITFGLYHMHYLMVAFDIFKSGAFWQVIPLSTTELLLAIGLCVTFITIESVIAFLVWRRVNKQKNLRRGLFFALLIIMAIISAYSLNFFANSGVMSLNESSSRSIFEAARLIPYYTEIYGLVMPGDASIRHIAMPSGNIVLQTRKVNRPLQYPLHLLQCKKLEKPLNILVIAIDTWRFDAMNPLVSPNIYQFAQHTLQFQDHWSGGNCTEPGLFSLFYGIPANYWRAVIKQKRGPEFITQLLKTHYHLAIFASAPLNFPAFDKTIFLEDKHLIMRTPGNTTIARDKKITQEFKNFLTTRNPQKPFFSFLFYDAAHNYCESTTPKKHPFKPWVKSCDRFSLTKNSDPKPYINRYHNAVYFIDHEVKQVLDAVKEHGLLDNTIVILTADHGEEINDDHSGYWEHASAYTAYQLHVPLLVYWPGKSAAIFPYFTTHYDLVPTLMSQVLGCENPLEDYTIGHSLFTPGNRSILIAGSYADYAIVANKRATRIYPGGDYVIDDERGQPLNGASLQKIPLQKGFEYLNKYFAGS